MLHQFFPAMSLLALCIGVNALALRLGAHTYSLPLVATSSLPATNTGTGISPAGSIPQCENIHSCRTLYDIVQTCLLTIFACVWVAVHPNIPPPPSAHKGRSCGETFGVWVLNLVQPAAIFPMALFVPEAILGMAIRQNMHASALWRRLEKARLGSKEKWVAGRQGDKETLEQLVTENNILSRARMVARLDEPWTKAHAFFTIMGGYQFYDKDGSRYALDPETVIKLVSEGEITAPTAAELSSWSNGDILSKGAVITQTLWFVTQCISRRVEHLPLTNLEAMTLAYALSTVTMYIAWWKKPLNVTCAIRVSSLFEQPLPLGSEEKPSTVPFIRRLFGRTCGFYVDPKRSKKLMKSLILTWSWAIIDGIRDDYVRLHLLDGVPTVWTGRPPKDVINLAQITSLCMAMAFGAVHCVAWSGDFPSRSQQQLWRWSTAAIVVLPTLVLAVNICAIGRNLSAREGKGETWSVSWWFNGFTLYLMVIGIPIYLCARVILATLSFTTLLSLPNAAYQTVEWTESIPHF